ncbi:helix-turn-helix domain-containing protein [Streptomyces globisporus]|uniref:helix-turn-helix domain-containing protein n=1 Tax=Streptomyces globisporus TaxID=1908 RepID=UPI0037C966BE
MSTLRGRVKELRGRAGMSAEALSARLQGLGVKWNRSIVANFEAGRRPSVSVVEWLALAQALEVAPLHLLISPDAKATDEYAYAPEPGCTAPTPMVREWVRGYYPLNADPGKFDRETPRNETVSVSLGETGYQVTLDRSPASTRALERFIREVTPGMGAPADDTEGDGK